MTDPYFWNSWNRSSSLTCAGRLRTKTLEVSLNEAFVLLLPRVKPLSADESMMAAALHTEAQLNPKLVKVITKGVSRATLSSKDVKS